MQYNWWLITFFLTGLRFFSQTYQNADLQFNFNDGEIVELNERIRTSAQGLQPTHDRFGNQDAAIYVQGHSASYLSLGTSPLLKTNNISISLWVKPERKVYVGSGYEANPILNLKNGPGSDFINAFSVGYDWSSRRLGCNSTKDSTEDVTILAKDTLVFNRWYHIVYVCNNDYLAFYVNGRLQGKSPKKFETRFLNSDSLVFGHSADSKNKRYMQGSFDDIRIFFHALTDGEVRELHSEPDPNKLSRMMSQVYKFVAIIVVLLVIIALLIVRNKRALRKQREDLELANKISNLELKAIKAQMNPHFISNCLAAIQELNYHADREKAGQYIAKFSFYLRQVLSYSDENYISAEGEIEMIKLFVELEQLRFGNGFTFDIQTDELMDLKNTLVPSLITQPFIENAIWHGLLPLRNTRHPELTVSFRISKGLQVIVIKDNGVGRDPDALQKKRSKGTRLALDKIETLNRISKTSNYKISIIDLKDDLGRPSGTEVNIYLDKIEE